MKTGSGFVIIIKVADLCVLFSGIVGELEDMRDERLSKIISQFQAYCKGHLMRVEYKKLCDQRWVFLCTKNSVSYLKTRIS